VTRFSLDFDIANLNAHCSFGDETLQISVIERDVAETSIR
jgi:hypothetical protein